MMGSNHQQRCRFPEEALQSFLVRIPKPIMEKIKEKLREDPDKYFSMSHFVRCGIMRELRESHKEENL